MSLPPDVAPDDVNLAYALQLLALPRTIGQHTETGHPVEAGIGRYGPYVKHQKTYRSIPAGESVLTIGMNRAIDLLAQGQRGSRPSSQIVLGPHPDDDQDVTVQEGRYGPYVKHGKINASLPKDVPMESVTLKQAVDLLASKAKTKQTPKRKPAARRGTKARKS